MRPVAYRLMTQQASRRRREREAPNGELPSAGVYERKRKLNIVHPEREILNETPHLDAVHSQQPPDLTFAELALLPCLEGQEREAGRDHLIAHRQW